MKWFRFWSEAAHDPKVQRLSAPLFKCWVNLMCLASEHDPRGGVPPIGPVAFVFRLSEERALGVLDDLVAAGLVDRTGDGLAMHSWGKRQFEGDGTTERVRRYRERVRTTGATVGGYLQHKEAIFQRDGHACVYCGATNNLCVDHMVPVLLGGTDDLNNLAVACKQCNSGKAGRTPEQAHLSFANPDAVSRLHAYRVTVTANGSVTFPDNRVQITEKTEREGKSQSSSVSDSSDVPRARIFTLYEDSFGLMNQTTAQLLTEAEDRYPMRCIEHAFEIGRENGARSWKYVETILLEHEVSGCEFQKSAKIRRLTAMAERSIENMAKEAK